jgi:hypothetical protein
MLLPAYSRLFAAPPYGRTRLRPTPQSGALFNQRCLRAGSVDANYYSLAVFQAIA